MNKTLRFICRTAWQSSLPLLLLHGFAHAQNVTTSNLAGKWKTKDGDAIYVFASNNDFEYHWLLRASAGRKGASSDVPTMRTSGAWELGAPACAIGQFQGNLMLYVSSTRCCFNVRFLGKNLILSHYTDGRSNPYSPCRDAVVTKVDK